jgi:hypothetical protein
LSLSASIGINRLKGQKNDPRHADNAKYTLS